MRKKWLLFVISGLIFNGCNGKEEEKQTEAAIEKTVYVQPVELKEISDSYQSDGTIIPLDKIDHNIDAEGTVKRLLKKNGDKVKKGEKVVELTDSKTESDYASAKAAFEAAQHSLNAAESNYEKFQVLYEKHMVSELEFLQYKNKYTDAKGIYISKKADLEHATENFKKLVRVAETDGIVGNLYLKIGNKVKAKETLFTVVNEEEMEVTIDFPGKWIGRLKTGDPAYIRISDLEGQEFKGFVKEINPVANPETKKFTVKVGFENPERRMKDGMYGKVSISAGKREGYVVSQDAVFVRDLLSYVFIVRDGEAKRVPVTLGAAAEKDVEIRESELKPGDLTVIDGLFGLEDGDEVKVCL